jgi:hypothetical protein
MNRKGGGWNQPAIIASAGYRVLSIKDGKHGNNPFRGWLRT